MSMDHALDQMVLIDDQAVADAHGWPASEIIPIRTSGRTEYGVHCGTCHQMHRHIYPGIKKGPCGAFYPIPEPEHDPDGGS